METLDDGCSILTIPIPTGDTHKRRLVRVATLLTHGVYQPTVHYDCLHNQIQSIHNRVCGVVPHPTPDGIKFMRRAAAAFARTIPKTCETDIFALSRRHPGAKGRRYADAAHRLQACGPSRTDSYVKAFVKPERFNLNDKVNPDPRMIQFRGPKFCVEIAAYLRPIEEIIYQTSWFSRGVPATRNVAKGLNSVERAELLVLKLKAFNDPVVVGIDASRFDKHVHEEHLRNETTVYTSSNPHPRFRKLLLLQRANTCFTTLGVKYKVAFRRMSGDMNTAIGNIVIMLIMIYAFLHDMLQLDKWDTLDDGDDALMIVERVDLPRLQAAATSSFLSMGMEIKIDLPVDNVHQIVFCKSQIIEYELGRYKFVRNYLDVISKALAGVRNWMNVTFRSRVVHAIGTCELVLNLGVPILQSFAMACLRNSSGRGVDHAPDGLRLRARRDAKLLGLGQDMLVTPQQIQPCARESFFLAFGVHPEDQRALEARLDKWTFDVTEMTVDQEFVDVVNWKWVQTTNETQRYPE